MNKVFADEYGAEGVETALKPLPPWAYDKKV